MSEKQYLVCIGCGEAFDDITAAHEHGVFIPGPDPSWCGENGFQIVPESEAF
jgi:predicted  nucleic acid-binding Zn-ribbon protein